MNNRDLAQELLRIASKIAAMGTPEEAARTLKNQDQDPFFQGLRGRMRGLSERDDPKMKGLRERMDEHPDAPKMQERFNELYGVEELEDAKFLVNMHTVSYEAPEDDEEDYAPEAEQVDSQENVEMDYEGLIYKLRDYTELSQEPVTTSRAWASYREEDMRTGDTLEHTIHINSINGKEPNVEQLKAIYSAAGLINSKF